MDKRLINHTEAERKQWATKGGKKKTKGYFGWLKENDPEKLRQIGIATSIKRKAKKDAKNT